MLYARSEDVFARDPELFRAHRERQERLRELQELYRLRLAHLKRAARELAARDGDPELLEPERAASIAGAARARRPPPGAHPRPSTTSSRPLGARSSARRWRATSPRSGAPWIAPRRWRSPAATSRSCSTACGCSASTAWSRGRRSSPGRPARWRSAERVVLFHDSPPQGQGNAEVLEAGLGCARRRAAAPRATATDARRSAARRAARAPLRPGALRGARATAAAHPPDGPRPGGAAARDAAPPDDGGPARADGGVA